MGDDIPQIKGKSPQCFFVVSKTNGISSGKRLRGSPVVPNNTRADTFAFF